MKTKMKKKKQMKVKSKDFDKRTQLEKSHKVIVLKRYYIFIEWTIFVVLRFINKLYMKESGCIRFS